jgi:hypothetical protein
MLSLSPVTSSGQQDISEHNVIKDLRFDFSLELLHLPQKKHGSVVTVTPK